MLAKTKIMNRWDFSVIPLDGFRDYSFEDPHDFQRMRIAIQFWQREHIGQKFSTRSRTDGMRVWRIT